MSDLQKLNVLMVGTGEYTTGFTDSGPSQSDKKVLSSFRSYRMLIFALQDRRTSSQNYNYSPLIPSRLLP